jgi:aspartyl-tRNA(Asn)/glutamyl-tRNA(Gln) amidotransferase subunit B
LSSEREIANYFDELVLWNNNYKAAANWVIGPVRSVLQETGLSISDFKLEPKRLAELIQLIDSGKLNYSVAANKVFPALINNPSVSAEQTAVSLEVLIDTNDDDLSLLIEEVLDAYPDKVKEFKQGKKGVLGLFMGELMKKSKGKLNPQIANKLIIEKLDNRL